MAFCSNCGQQISDGTVFCGNCGAGQDGAGSPGGSQVDVNEFMDIAKGTLVGMITSPITTIRSIVNIKLQYSLIMAGVLAVIYGLVSVIVAQMGASAILGGFSGMMNEVMGQVFFYSMIYGLIMIGGMFLGLFLLGKAFGGGGEAGEYLIVATASQVPLLAALVAGVILLNITYYLFSAVIFIGAMISIICIFCGLNQASGLNENKSAMVTSLSYIVMLLVLFFVVYTVFS